MARVRHHHAYCITKSRRLAFATVGSAALIAGCSAVGPGLANHPIDCAMGIKWVDCLPGTAGYKNGGGQQTRAVSAQQQMNAIRTQFQVAGEQ